MEITMEYRKIVYSEKYPDVYLTAYISEDKPVMKMPPRKAMIVCPGGGYEFLSPREAEPIAKKFFAEGFNVFILHYSVAPNAANFAPIIQLSLAITYIRQNASAFHINPKLIFVIGFSAGGHLAASSGVLWNSEIVRNAVGIGDGGLPEAINKPTGTILCYPVISAGEYAHKGSFDALCGNPQAPGEERAPFSLELHVDENTSPVFIWHTFTDTCVPVENTILYIQALAKHKVPFEAHIFPYGRHGLSLATKETWSQSAERYEPHVQCWFDLALNWLEDFTDNSNMQCK